MVSGLMVKPARDRFWDKVDIRDETRCWPWLGASNQEGYGRFKHRSQLVLAHRFSYEDSIGPIPDGQLVLHHCDNPHCVNPSHLFVGDYSDNALDMYAKGRRASGGKRRPPRIHRLIERNGRAIVNPRFIEMMVASGLNELQLARKHRLSRKSVQAMLAMGRKMVGTTGIEPVTPAMSRRCSPAELRALPPSFRQADEKPSEITGA